MCLNHLLQGGQQARQQAKKMTVDRSIGVSCGPSKRHMSFKNQAVVLACWIRAMGFSRFYKAPHFLQNGCAGYAGGSGMTTDSQPEQVCWVMLCLHSWRQWYQWWHRGCASHPTFRRVSHGLSAKFTEPRPKACFSGPQCVSFLTGLYPLVN